MARCAGAQRVALPVEILDDFDGGGYVLEEVDQGISVKEKPGHGYF